MKSIKLIVNGDDFGASHEVNEAIIRAHREGVLTSCSLMAGGAAFREAVRLAKENRTLAVGLHLVAVMGRAVLPHRKIPYLTDDRGFFRNDPARAGLAYFFSRQARRELRKEIGAQFAQFKSTGLPLSHIDGHLHMHVHPVIFALALEFGQLYGVKQMRVPDEEFFLIRRYDPTCTLHKALYALPFMLLARYMKARLRSRSFHFTNRVYGNFRTGKMDEKYFLYTLQHLHRGTNEIYFHPAVYQATESLSAEQKQCITEFQALMSPKVKQFMAQAGIELTSYPHLATGSRLGIG